MLSIVLTGWRRGLTVAMAVLGPLGLAGGIASVQDPLVYYIANGATEIHRARLDGSGGQLVLAAPLSRAFSTMSVTEDGGRMAYIMGPASESHEVWTARTDGSSPLKLADASWAQAVVWLPGDAEVAFNRADGSGGGGGSRLYRIPGTGGTESVWLSADPYLPLGLNTFRPPGILWSADRTRFVTNIGVGGGAANTIFVGTIDIAAGTVADVRRLSPMGSGSWSGGVALGAEITADGSTVFYTWREESLGRAELRRVGFDGTGGQVIRTTSDTSPPVWPRISPDGGRLWFLEPSSGAGDPDVIASVLFDGTDYREHVSSAGGLGPFDFGPAVECRGPLCSTDVSCDFEDGATCGTPVGTVHFCPAACGDGLCLAGNGSIDLGDDDRFSTSHLEVELDVRVDRIPGPGQTAAALVTKYRGHSAGESEWALFVEKEGRWVLCGDGSGCVSSPPGSVGVGVPYQVRAVLRGGHGEVWVNGSLVASGAVVRNPINTSTPAIIGNTAQPGHDNPFHGTIDNLRIGCVGGNRPPVADAGDDQVVEATSPSGALVVLDGSDSSDPDGDPLTYEWSWPPSGTASGPQPNVLLPLGQHTITLTVNDGNGGNSTDEVNVTVQDTTSPAITVLQTNPAALWPPTHKLVPVHVTAAAEDSVDGSPTCAIASVASDEPPDGHEPDWVVTPPLGLSLRAERLGTGSGRIYTVAVECRDASGNSVTGQVEVRVPHDKGKN